MLELFWAWVARFAALQGAAQVGPRMTTIKARCAWCDSVVRLAPDDIELVVAEGVAVRFATYSFDCPECGEHSTKDADERVEWLLMSGGVVRHNRTPEPARKVRPLSHDDLLDAHLLLADDDKLRAELEGL